MFSHPGSVFTLKSVPSFFFFFLFGEADIEFRRPDQIQSGPSNGVCGFFEKKRIYKSQIQYFGSHFAKFDTFIWGHCFLEASGDRVLDESTRFSQV